ncbi:helix-turn-helix domain-containing protein [Aquibacillus koreensis]|uniref:Helix-turn-helix domain-containing protein n=1 Tax=Aquibacillus koreensis TaxID=279446 RepID=A0A9X3WQD7_9BACI|nr:helix-turn-helix domain-containing protein [Aquibacillus koreensis]MCT2536730.1 helix-turn-helix domain-containing protein [Aquibacillus koreensis]MDC3421514.1 helix-turn-helix domain-containing protein [Aquibacillus koreensis]
MHYQYEQIDYQVDLPINIFTHTVEQFPFHWHEATEILFVLEGELDIRVNQDDYHLQMGDVFLVNGNELHFINSKTVFGQTQVLALQFDNRYFKNLGTDLEQKRFYLNSREVEEGSMFVLDEIKYILANMMDLVLNKKNLYHLKVKKMLLDLVVILLEHFEVPTTTKQKRMEDDQRLAEILHYMNDHCLEVHFGLQDIAKKFSLNPHYLSRYFKSNVGVSLKKYLDSMRLNKSLFTLRTTEETVTEIALKFGFPDSKAYYRVFKEVLGITPMQYREQYQLELKKGIVKDYLSINSKESFTNLFKYLDRKDTGDIQITKGETRTIDVTNYLHKIDRSFTRLSTFGFAPHALRKDFYDQLKQIQGDIGFEYIRFHGIFSDQLMVYNERSDGSFYFNFNHIDSLLDNLLDAHVKPFIEIGFMPKDLASTEKKIFWWDAFVSPPKEMDRWIRLLDAFFRHVMNRYGLQEVRTWYFEFWNEPEVQHFWGGTRQEFFTFYAESYRCIKAIDPELKIGGFGTINFSKHQTWLSEFDAFAEKEKVGVDFFSFHVYNLSKNSSSKPKSIEIVSGMDLTGTVMQKVAESNSIMLGDEHNFSKIIDDMIHQSKELVTLNQERWITEWNANTDSRDLLHDTCYMGAFITKNVIENFEKVKGMGFWTFTDIFDEFQLEQPLFHGGFGLMTYNGIKKAGYHAFYFLSKLGDYLVTKLEDMIVTKSGEDYQILLFNYSHPNHLYRSFDYSQLSPTSRYKVFEDERVKSIQLTLEGLHGEYIIKKQYVNRHQGSSYDAWVDTGAPSDMDDDTINYMKGRAEPGVKIQHISAQNNYRLETFLHPHEIQLIEIIRRY